MKLEKKYHLIKQIDDCFLALNGANLPSPPDISDRYLWLHEKAPYAILAVNAIPDPVYFYVNDYALSRFKYSPEEMLVLPARFSAASDDREEREALLNKAKRDGIAYNYTGQRVDKYGNSFTIHGGIVWQLEKQDGEVWGQAALFWPEEKERPEWYKGY